MAETIVSSHIEKTGGTSIEKLYCDMFGAENIVLYSPLTDSFKRANRELLPRRSPVIDSLKYKMGKSPSLFLLNRLYSLAKRSCGGLEDFGDARVVHGHFQISRIQVANPLLAIVFREPLERMISQYQHWYRTKGEVEWRVRIPFDSTMTLEDYSMLPDLQNYQVRAMDGHNLSDFTFVGVCERLDNFAKELAEYAMETYGIAGNFPLARLNRNPSGEIGINNGFENDFRKQHQADYEVYEMALKSIVN